ncbi:CubicO group peptidase (beta-lactamase class C family) [Limnobacter thiooxidans]|uniref:EstA family serine hydrolase n=1 Tax=Limnobacter thiooxidans TaxID=131080 RepID=A0AA86M865_9BURK|nr:CubicO group peptidase (beta-lactamase class C family) [Limnobacter thiooxidans]BET25304.1 EstA family serine hydrolase [Limnobacter thiooxidans]
MFKKANTVPVPKNLGGVTQIDSKAEVSPYDVSMTRDNVEAIWNSVESFYRTGLQPGMTMVVRRQGEIVLKRSIGHARGNPPPQHPDQDVDQVLMTPDTPICLFSASKAITAMLVHKLQEQGKLDLNDTVGKYIPEFACNGKEGITIAHVLSHRAGVPQIPISNPHPSLLFKWDSVIDLINAGYTKRGDGSQQAYHAIVGGYILGELVQRITGESIQANLQKFIAKPLNAKYLTYGLNPEHHDSAAYNYSTGALPVFPINVLAKRALNIDFEKIASISNSTDFLNASIPAGNIYGTADEVSRFYQMMLDGGQFNGKQLFEAETIKLATKPAGGLSIDQTLMIPIRFSTGFMLGENLFSLFGVKARKAYGHLGLINIVTWADPARDISVAFLNTGKSLDPRSVPALGKILVSVSSNCSVLK